MHDECDHFLSKLLDCALVYNTPRGRECGLRSFDLAVLVPFGRCNPSDVFLYAQVLQNHRHAIIALLHLSLGSWPHGRLSACIPWCAKLGVVSHALAQNLLAEQHRCCFYREHVHAHTAQLGQ